MIEYRDRLKAAMQRANIDATALRKAMGVSYQAVKRTLDGKTGAFNAENNSKAARALGVDSDWLASGNSLDVLTPVDRHPTAPPNAALLDMPLRASDEDGVASLPIEYWDAHGSCGGGSNGEDATLKGYLAKEPTWFQRYGVKPKDTIAILADGDSMSDFIVDGDIVIFDTSKTEPRSGAIFLIQHPDGLRVKQLRREIDGTWVLESRNPNKARFPDERIPPEYRDRLIIKGEFVYRQGG